MVSTAAARKTVSVLFCDLADSTALGERIDPEPLRELLGRWYEEMRIAVERHGGTVEKFVGDAVMAVFGAPVAHEDDPERAVRAALEIRDALMDSDVDSRIAVHTGEALVALDARADEGEALVVWARTGGHPVFLAALHHTASPFDVVQAVNGLAGTLQQIDTGQLANAFTDFRAVREGVEISTGIVRLLVNPGLRLWGALIFKPAIRIPNPNAVENINDGFYGRKWGRC